MTTGDIAEGSLPDEEHHKKTLIKQAEFWLKMHDVYERAARVFVDIKHWMAHWTDRGPRDYSPPADADALVSRAAREGAYQATLEIQGGYHEGGDKGSTPQWRNWVMTMLGTLIVIGVTGLVVMYANQKAMGERMDGFEKRITNIEHKVWP